MLRTVLKPMLLSECVPHVMIMSTPKFKTRFGQVVNLFHGSKTVVYISSTIAVSSLICQYIKPIEGNELYAAMFYILLYFSGGDLMYRWVEKRPITHELLNDLLNIVTDIEWRSDQDMLNRMKRVTRVTRITVLIYGLDVFLILNLYCMYPVYYRRFPVYVPYIPEWSVYAVIMHIMQIHALISISTVVFIFFAVYLQFCVYLATSLRALANLFGSFESREDFDRYVEIHQRLLVISTRFRDLFAPVWRDIFGVLIVIVSVLSFLILAGSHFLLFYVLLVSCVYLLGIPCLAGELLSSACVSIGFSVYDNQWFHLPRGTQKDIVLVILKSQKPTFVTAGLLGRLDLRKYQWFVQKWYTMVQGMRQWL